MKKKNLIKTIKKSALKQFENDLINSILKELYEGASKKQIKKIRKQVLREMQKELFGKESIVCENKSDVIPATTEISKEQKPAENKMHECGRLNLDINRMRHLVSGYKTEAARANREKLNETARINRENSYFPTSNIPSSELDSQIESNIPLPELDGQIKSLNETDSIERINIIKKGGNKDAFKTMIHKEVEKISLPLPSKHTQWFDTELGLSNSNLANEIRFSKDLEESGFSRLTPFKKEDISFFVDKLKKNIKNLGKGERIVAYRKKSDDLYVFSFEKKKLDEDDFSFKFEFDLNMHTYNAEITVFSFNIDGFSFEKGFLEILDIVKILDVFGINLMKHINEIREINDTDVDVKSKIESDIDINNINTKYVEKLEEFIFDNRIIKILKNNDINTYRQLKKVKDLTSLKGVGSKTAEIILNLLNN